jgi:hypothetical protein
MKTRSIRTRADLLQAVQHFESALASTRAGTATGREYSRAAEREARRIDDLRAALITFAHTLPD